MKKLLFPLCMLLLLFFCILQPAKAISGAAAGLSLWYCTLLPTLLPCMVLSGYLISSELILRLPPAPFAFLTGWFCGYPMGAKTIADLWKHGRLSEASAKRLLVLCCVPSPMFLTGFLCTGMLRLPLSEAVPCLAALYLPPVLCWLITCFWNRGSLPGTGPISEEKPSGSLSAFFLFEKAMMNGFLIIAKVGGYLMFFTMLSYFFRDQVKNLFFASLIPGIFEMTSGIAFTVQSGLSRTLTVALCFSFAAFGGLSGAAQTISVLEGTPFSGRRYLLWKLLQASVTFFLIWIIL